MVGQSFHLMTNSRGSLGKNIAGFREDNQFCDVTLVCDDGASFKAHRVILASQSDKLRTILTEFQDSQFCLYLAGMDSKQVSSLLAFIYSGEAMVSQRDLSAFLAAAQTLKIGGLVEDNDGDEVTEDITEKDAEEEIVNDNKDEVKDTPVQSVGDVADQNHVSLKTKYKVELPSTGTEDQDIWDNVNDVSYEFLKGGKSRQNGILTTHERSYKVSV